MLGSLFLCVSLAVSPVQGSALGGPIFDSIPGALAGLTSDRAAARFAAERYLGAALGPDSKGEIEDYVASLEIEGGGSMEVYWRIGNAIGARPGGLALALGLIHNQRRSDDKALDLEPLVLGDTAPESGLAGALDSIGRHALDQLLASWRPGLDRLPVAGAALQLLLPDQRELWAWTPITLKDGPVEEVVGRLQRLGQLPVPLVIAPGLAEALAEQRLALATEPATQTFAGPWDEVLLDFAQAHGLAWEAVMWEGEFGDEIAWLRLVSLGERPDQTGLEQVHLALADYARKVWGEAGRADSAGTRNTGLTELDLAAAFLGGIEWPAAHSWLGDLWFDGQPGDPVALGVLLDVAGRGAFEPRMLEPAGLGQLLQLEAPGLARALARLPRMGPSGALEPVLLEGWPGPGATANELYLRFVALEAVGGGGASGAGHALAVLGQRGADAPWGLVELAALRVLAAVRAGQPQLAVAELVIEHPAALLQLAGPLVAPDELGRLLFQARVQFRPGDLAAGELRPIALRALFVAALLAGDAETCGELLVDVVEVEAPGSWQSARRGAGGSANRSKFFAQISACLEVAVRRGDLIDVRAALAAARSRSAAKPAPAVEPAFPFTALDRMELLTGSMSRNAQNQLVELLASGGPESPLFLDTIAIVRLAAGPMGAAPRALLVERFEKALESPRVGAAEGALAAIEATLALLWSHKGDEEARELILSSAEAAASVPSHPLARRVLYQAWPPAFARISRNLDRSDR